jgi:phage shock protein E
MKKTLVISLILFALLLAGCAAAAPSETDEGGYAFISVEELSAMLEARRESFLLVNTHIPFEGDIPTTDFSVPYNETAQRLASYPEDKDAEIVLYCMSDRMARIAADVLVEAGYTNLAVLSGGMIAWDSAGLPLILD